jgi:hypothetical protein
MHKSATKCNEILSKWCKNKHGVSKIIDTFETYQLVPAPRQRRLEDSGEVWWRRPRTTLLEYTLSQGALCRRKPLFLDRRFPRAKTIRVFLILYLTQYKLNFHGLPRPLPLLKKTYTICVRCEQSGHPTM